MVEFLPLGIIAISIVLAFTSFVRDRLDRLRLAATSSGSGLPLDPVTGEPVTLSGFDPKTEALLVQLPHDVFDHLDHADFVTRAAPDGAGQELLFRERLLLRLPDLAPRQRFDLFVEPMPG